MALSKINDFLQTFATLGALVGLMLVGYQVRESNRIASQQMASSAFTLWTQSAIADVESGVFAAVAKSIISPDELTFAEKHELDAYYHSLIYRYSHDLLTVRFDQRSVAVEIQTSILDGLTRDAPELFGSRFSRGWFQENKVWIDPEIVAALELGLKDAPIGSGLDYFERIDNFAATME